MSSQIRHTVDGPLTAAEAAAAHAAIVAWLRGEVNDPLTTPVGVGTAALKLQRMAEGRKPVVCTEATLDGVVDGLYGNNGRRK